MRCGARFSRGIDRAQKTSRANVPMGRPLIWDTRDLLKCCSMRHFGAEVAERLPNERSSMVHTTMRSLASADQSATFLQPPRSFPPSAPWGGKPGSGLTRIVTCGPDRIRTGDLLPAEQALYQLSYRPSLTCGNASPASPFTLLERMTFVALRPRNPGAMPQVRRAVTTPDSRGR